MKKDWEIKKLGDVCEIINGKNQKAVEDKNGPYPIYGSGGIMGYASEYLCRENTTIIGRKGSINNPLYVEEKFWNVDTAFGFQSKKNYIPKLLFYFCKSFDFSTHNKGTTIPSLVKSDLLEIAIPLPPLEEQKRIVKILDEKFAQLETIKTNAQTNLQNAKDLFQSQLTKAFSNITWEKKSLGDEFYVKSGGTPSRSKNEYWDGDIPWYSSGELGNKYTTTSERDINSLAIDNSNAKLFPKGSLLIGMYDTAAMKMSILDRDATFNQAIAGVKPNDKHDLQFIRFYLDSIKAEMFELRRGTRQKNLSLEKIKEIIVPLPPLSEQKCIVKELDTLSEKVRQLQEIYTKQIANCDELKQSLLQKAFEGELSN